jgi:hypothetical protein
MENQTNQGIKALSFSILALLILILFLNIDAIQQQLGRYTLLFVCLIIVGILYVYVSQVKSIHYSDDIFEISYSGYSKPKLVTIKKEEIIKIAFHGKEGRNDNYWIKFYLKKGYPQRFNLYYNYKYVFTLMDKIKEHGFVLEYE